MIRSWMTTLTVFCITTALFGASENFYGNVTIESKPAFNLTGSYTEKNGIATKTTNYFTTSGQQIISEKVRYKDDSFDLIGYTIHDSRSGRYEEIVRKNNNYVVRYQQNSSKQMEEKIINDDGKILHSSNIALFIQKNVEDLIKQNEMTFKLLIPEHMKVIEFQIRLTDAKVINGQDCYEFRMEPTLWVLKPLVKSMFFYYEKQAPHKFFTYIGPILPRDKQGRQLVGTINFRYLSPS